MHLYLLINLLRATANGRFLGDNRSILATFAPVLPDHLSSSHLAGTRNEQETSRSLLYLSSVAPGFACSPLCEQGHWAGLFLIWTDTSQHCTGELTNAFKLISDRMQFVRNIHGQQKHTRESKLKDWFWESVREFSLLYLFICYHHYNKQLTATNMQISSHLGYSDSVKTEFMAVRLPFSS